MAARKDPRNRDSSNKLTPYKYYVYKFYDGDICAYVGKGCGKRFSIQKRRFKHLAGSIVAYFISEDDALAYERSEILTLAPCCNVIHNPGVPAPWRHVLVPKNNQEFYAWCSALGTREMAARVVLSKDWRYLKRYGVDIKALISKVEPNFPRFSEVLYGTGN